MKKPEKIVEPVNHHKDCVICLKCQYIASEQTHDEWEAYHKQEMKRYWEECDMLEEELNGCCNYQLTKELKGKLATLPSEDEILKMICSYSLALTEPRANDLAKAISKRLGAK